MMPLNVKLLSHVIRGYKSKARNAKCNNGVQKRLNLIRENNPDLENIDIDEQKLDNLDDGILDVNTCNDYSQRLGRDVTGIVQYKNIERKFFKKEVYPNLLSWSEKEQIRFLYNSDTKTWSPERLSESFPATADVIKKLIKAQWKPMCSDRITHHDESVCKNWKAIERGDLKIPDVFYAHIKKFISRKKVANLNIAEKSLEEVNSFPNTSSEFLSIIKTYKNKTSEYNPQKENNSCNVNLRAPNHKNETYVLDYKDNLHLKHKYYTLSQLKNELKAHKTEHILHGKGKGNGSASENETIVDSQLTHSSYSIRPTNSNANVKNYTLSSSIESTEEIPLKIRIPKDKMVRDKNHVYKVKDCYYDYSGEFLYKVPGLE